MNDKFENNEQALRRRDEVFESQAAPQARSAANGRPHPNGHAVDSTFSFWSVLEILSQRWGLVFLGGLLGAGALFCLGLHWIKPKFIASAQLMRYENPIAKEF